ncbi:MAG: hypothetical protein QXG39_01960 [Candidatus Aenigmatarchaeota archaeon]
MKVLHFTSSRRFIRNLMEVDKNYTVSLVEDAFYRNYERELALTTLKFLEEELYPRKEKVEFLRDLRKNLDKFEYPDKIFVVYTEPYFPYNFYFRKEGDRIVQRENLLGIPLKSIELIPKTSRDLYSKVNPAIDIISKIINSYKFRDKSLSFLSMITLVTPIGFVPFNPINLEPFINFNSFSVPDITDYQVVERLTRFLRLRSELMGKKPPKDSDLEKKAFDFYYKGKEREMSWGEVEKICIKLNNQHFINEAKKFIEKNLKQKPILFLTGKSFSKNLRKVLEHYRIYDPELDVVKEFLNNNFGDKEYMSWGLGTSRLIGRYITDSRGVRKFLPGKLEKIIKDKFGFEKFDLVYNSSLLEEPLRERKLQKFFDIWFDEDHEKIYCKPVECRRGGIFLDFNDESLCTLERYEKWKKGVKEENWKNLENFVKLTNKIQQWTGIIQAIQMKIEEEMYPFEKIRERSLHESCDYHFSDFGRTPVENVLRDLGFREEIEREVVTTAQGIRATLQELSEIGNLIHDVRRSCSLSKHDFKKFTEVPLSLKLESPEYGDFRIEGRADIVLVTEGGKVHVCDTKLGAPFSPPVGHVYQVLAASLALHQDYGFNFDTGSNYYHTNVFKEGMIFIHYFPEERVKILSSDMIQEVHDYLQMKDNPKTIPRYFKKYQQKMKDPEKMKRMVEDKLGLKI